MSGMGFRMRREQVITQERRQLIVQSQRFLGLRRSDFENRLREEAEHNPFLRVNSGGRRERRHEEGIDFSVNTDAGDWHERRMASVTERPSLSGHLLSQLECWTEDARELAIGGALIANIDEKGYLAADVDDLAEELDTPVEEVARVLARIQTFEPAGVGARTTAESLLIQARLAFPEDRLLERFIAECLEPLREQGLDAVAAHLGIGKGQLNALVARLRTLNLYPGRDFGSSRVDYAVPDVIVEEVNGRFLVRPSDMSLTAVLDEPVIRAFRGRARTPDEKERVTKHVENARLLANCARFRGDTLLRVARAIVDVQEPFLRNGIEGFQPLLQKDLAETLGLDASTISRALKDKYLQCPQGVMPMSDLLSEALKTAGGGTVAVKAVHHLLRTIVNEEDKAAPLSDEKLCDALRQRGIEIAQRTVAKYRQCMGIPASKKRRASVFPSEVA